MTTVCDDCRGCSPVLAAQWVVIGSGGIGRPRTCEICGHRVLDHHRGRFPSLLKSSSRPAPSPAATPPVPALIRVIPVAKALKQRYGPKLYLEVVSIYTTGVQVRCTEFSEDLPTVTYSSINDVMEGRSMWAISDDAQTPYRVTSSGGGWSGLMGSTEVSFEPGPTSTATTMTLVYNGQSVVIDLATGVAAH